MFWKGASRWLPPLEELEASPEIRLPGLVETSQTCLFQKKHTYSIIYVYIFYIQVYLYCFHIDNTCETSWESTLNRDCTASEPCGVLHVDVFVTGDCGTDRQGGHTLRQELIANCKASWRILPVALKEPPNRKTLCAPSSAAFWCR